MELNEASGRISVPVTWLARLIDELEELRMETAMVPTHEIPEMDGAIDALDEVFRHA